MNTRRITLTIVLIALMLGAQAGPAFAVPPRSCAAFHVVQPGENLFRIGLQFGMTVDVLMRANGILNPNLIYVGQSLCIPGGTTPPPTPQPGTGTFYTVKFGDTLSVIALRFGVSVFAIMRANGITNPNLIFAGMVLFIPGAGTQPGTSFPQWKGEYFNNPNLAGTPSLVRNDPTINFNWGLGWPTPRVSADNFSVRWTRTLFFGTSNFRFTAAADDGLRLFVDNVLVIDQWHAATGTAYTADVPLGAGNHTIRMEMYEATGNASASLSWARVAPTTPGPTPIPGATPTPTGGSAGGIWTGYYFRNQNLDDLAFTRLDPTINFDWGTGSPGPGVPNNLFSVRWISTQNFSNGLYQFNAIVDDGVRIYVDDQVVVNEWTNHAGTTVLGTVNLTAGVHTVKVEYYEFGHDAKIVVWWTKP